MSSYAMNIHWTLEANCEFNLEFDDFFLNIQGSFSVISNIEYIGVRLTHSNALGDLSNPISPTPAYGYSLRMGHCK